MTPDIGFRVLKIADSAFEPINETQTRIRDFCSEETAFFEVMTTAGIDLGAPVQQIMLNCGKRIWQAGNTDAMTGHAAGQAVPGTPTSDKTHPDPPRPDIVLLACFERTLTDVNPRTLALDIARIAAPGHTLFVFMDAAFGSPQEQEQAQHAPKQCLLDYLQRNDVGEIIHL